MKYFFCLLSITLFSSIFINKSFAATQDVIINEIGASERTNYEWVEIYNHGSQPIDLANWKFVENFTDSSPNGTNHGLNFSGTTTLNPNQYAVIAQDATKFKEKYPNFTGLLIDSSWSTLNESGEKIGLKDADGNFSELFIYIEAKNFSLERKNPNLNDYTAANWQEHPSGNTVGAPNSNQQSNNQTQESNQQSNQNINASNDQEQAISSSNSNPPVRQLADGQAPNITANAGENIVALISQEITFDASKSQGNIANYEWNFGDGQTSKEKISKHKYDFAGKYIAILTISDGQSQAQSQITASIYPSGVYINEFIPSPQGTDSENEWIEIRNANNFPVDLSEWILNNNSKSFSIPQNTFISPQSYLALSRKTTGITLPNTNGFLKFSYPENIIIDEIKYDKTKEGYSASRKQDNNFIWTRNPTPGAPNILISEIKMGSSAFHQSTAITAQNQSPQNLIAKNQFSYVISENSTFKNFINAASAHHDVYNDVAEENDQTTKENASSPININANISQINFKNKNVLFFSIGLAIAGFFVLMWQVLKNRS